MNFSPPSNKLAALRDKLCATVLGRTPLRHAVISIGRPAGQPAPRLPSSALCPQPAAVCPLRIFTIDSFRPPRA